MVGRQGETMAGMRVILEWIHRALRRAEPDRPGTVETKMHALRDAARHEFPTADIQEMLREIESEYIPRGDSSR